MKFVSFILKNQTILHHISKTILRKNNHNIHILNMQYDLYIHD